MDNQNANAFISNANFTEENNLVQLLESSNDFENVTDVKLSPYVDIETLKENLYESKSNLSILSINSQSINAKFDEFKIAIEQLSYKHPVHIICVQEIWIESNCNTCMFELPNYQLMVNIVLIMAVFSLMFMMTFIGNQWKLKNIRVEGKIYSLKFNENQKIKKNTLLEIFIDCQMNLFLILQHLMKNSLKLWIFCIPKERPHMYAEILI